ncbi:tetrapyrrole/corrin/porphyrin methyltransferase [Acetobacter nitrogenifigens DSM 23921 = NBRC 105050]|uniref:Ribosomal RNA small subunit methyltransferase I n=1 Tax=Acetobacter nitrogenifigens DSM 23921 = NBRC 105050 TaxID=1120919 RepID=A0A511XDJ8_9PROT|nr:16S rRNA (cytidine(1402)-2'-O)-methyltransferase [Acetobacter nitrogenifigens]GBQ97364.1 tetrapyrrole/corrin/porphyrin methyltransferase [Acetobacter nitrogenifigens DSM 23921 = NBRC 105050]GEN61026.1 ribosomal RNA small subunit methyltransferase I [Acetobacter nitrogenifigens DSM 23921 = NBRC 105050]
MSDPSFASSSKRLSDGDDADAALPHSEGLRPRHVRDDSTKTDAGEDPPAYESEDHGPVPGSQRGGLTLVATPIGNLGDLPPRAVEAMRDADLVLCEDTRVTARLFSEHGISPRSEALHEHNERQRTPALVERLRRGARIALVSDAGMPLLSDPGYRLTRAAIDAEVPVTAVPGPNAALTALVLSGLPPHPFLFLGFPPPRSAARRSAFATLRAAELAGLRATLIWHEAPHRLGEMLADLAAAFGDGRAAVVARELTKRFEEVRRGGAAELAAAYADKPPRGEIVVLLGPPDEDEAGADDLDTSLSQALETHSVKDAAALVAAASGLPRKLVYARALELSAARKK